MKNRTIAILPLLILALLFMLVGFTGYAAASEVIQLDSLGELYGPVAFDHELHTQLGEDCSICHHHTTGTGPENENCARCHSDTPESDIVACSDCHEADPFGAQVLQAKAENRMLYHKDKPGLKAVYHMNCLGCHEAWGAPTGCQECHARTAAGDDYYHADAEGESAHH